MVLFFFWDSLCRATVALRMEDEFRGCSSSTYETVPGKAGQALRDTVGWALFGESCIVYHGRRRIIYHLWPERVWILRSVHRQCLEVGQLVLSSFLSPLMSGGRKFKSNVTGCTLCFQQTGHREGYGEKRTHTQKKGSESNVMREGKGRHVVYWGRQVSLPFGAEMCCKVSVFTVWKYPCRCLQQRSW